MSSPFFGSVTVPGSAARHPRVLVLVEQESECLLLLETLAGAGMVASGLVDVGLGRDVLRAMRFEVVVLDRAMAAALWGPLMVALGQHRTRVVLLTPEGATATDAPAVEGMQ